MVDLMSRHFMVRHLTKRPLLWGAASATVELRIAQ